jgi:hypothetical protein
MKLTPPSSWRLGQEGLNHHEFNCVFQVKKWYVGPTNIQQKRPSNTTFIRQNIKKTKK